MFETLITFKKIAFFVRLVHFGFYSSLSARQFINFINRHIDVLMYSIPRLILKAFKANKNAK